MASNGSVAVSSPIPNQNKTKPYVSFFGYGSVQPSPFFQRVLNNAKAFVFLLTLANIIQGITINGLLKVNVTTIERRFNLLSSESGFIISSYDVAGCLALLPVSYLGGKGHRPRWIGFGLILTSVGILTLSLPHFISETYSYSTGVYSENTASCTDSTMIVNNDEKKCSRDSTDMKYVFILGQLLIGAGSTPLAALSLTFLDDSVDPSVYPIYIGIYYMGALIGPAIGFILGGQLLKIFTIIGVVPTDITPESPQWIGAWWIGFVICAVLMFFVSIPILGYPKSLPSKMQRKPTLVQLKELTASGIFPEYNKLIGKYNHKLQSGGVSESNNENDIQSNKADDSMHEKKVHEKADNTCTNSDDNSEQNVSKKNVNIVFSEEKNGIEKDSAIKPNEVEKENAEEIKTALPLTAPSTSSCKNVKFKQSRKSVTFSVQDDDTLQTTIALFLCSLKVVVKNSAFLFLSLSAAVLGTLVSGFSTFGPKFIESQFGKSSSEAANIFGYVFLPAGTVGLVSGSIVMSGLKLVHRKALQMCLIVSTIGLLVQFAIALHCKDITVAGLNIYNNTKYQNASLRENYVFPCNEECVCPFGTFDPVCGSDGITYYSSCFASCHSKDKSENSTSLTFSNCSCIANGSATKAIPLGGTAVIGKCEAVCQWYTITLAALFILGLTTFMCAIPGADLSLRCFASKYRSLSVGVQWILIRTLGTIPGPIIFGALIDKACSLWNLALPCASSGQSCALYENKQLSFNLLYLSMIFKGVSVCGFIGALTTYVPHVLTDSEINIEASRSPERSTNRETIAEAVS